MNRFSKAAILGTTMFVAAGAASAEIVNADQLNANETVVENAMKISNFSTLVAAVKAAGLAEPLMGEGPYTILAPTDAAFDKLDDGAVESLMAPENREQLTGLLQAHVIPGLLTQADIEKLILEEDVANTGVTVNTVDGEGFTVDTLSSATDISFMKEGSGTYVSTTLGGSEAGIKIIEGDIMGSNGVVHVIDGVLMPGK
ncbi:Uncaracterized surface protein containing fasciclin (FAS1) repeats [Poseidonocella pacifica]|uniref:Uncaracterized surface protein containing fasciclin (FAS1) repeats n=1 Tax=Poseidonocella pacifica TaxID=871651 RepID=A0A1I0WE13_9RHOB|nr:fasciclin domain-containing protein [Poseidonocella pacifica]SFA86995.1 Uncaracterized surface protein containing fasciclin (FAS1) repeats [Poseidonocella pacifica]